MISVNIGEKPEALDILVALTQFLSVEQSRQICQILKKVQHMIFLAFIPLIWGQNQRQNSNYEICWLIKPHPIFQSSAKTCGTIRFSGLLTRTLRVNKTAIKTVLHFRKTIVIISLVPDRIQFEPNLECIIIIKAVATCEIVVKARSILLPSNSMSSRIILLNIG